MSKERISILLKSFSQRPIAYQKIYAQITGSIRAGLLLSQVVYWWYAMEEREFYKTDKEFREELAMGPREFKTAKSRLKMLKLVSITVKGIPAKTYYKLKETELLDQISSWAETHQLDKPKRPDCTSRNVSTITKTNLRDHKIKYSTNSVEFRLSKLLLDLILERKSNFRKPNLQKWCIHVDRLIRIDKRTPEQIEAVIRWCQEDNFWQNNILSTEKLRKQIDRLELAMEKTGEQEDVKPLQYSSDGFTPRERFLIKLEKEKQQEIEDTERTQEYETTVN